MKRHTKPQTPNLAICGWVRVPRPKPRFGDLYQRGDWYFARVQKGLGDSLDVPRKGVIAVRRLAHGPHTLVLAMPGWASNTPQGFFMEFSSYVTLLSSLATEAFTIWGLLATVSIGLIAFVGSLKQITIPFGLTISFVFLLFAASNFLALEKNFTSRQIVAATAERMCPEDFKNNKDLVHRLAMTYDPDVETSKFIRHPKMAIVNLALHIALVTIVAIILIGFTVARARKRLVVQADAPTKAK